MHTKERVHIFVRHARIKFRALQRELFQSEHIRDFEFYADSSGESWDYSTVVVYEISVTDVEVFRLCVAKNPRQISHFDARSVDFAREAISISGRTSAAGIRRHQQDILRNRGEDSNVDVGRGGDLFRRPRRRRRFSHGGRRRRRNALGGKERVPGDSAKGEIRDDEFRRCHERVKNNYYY